MVMTLTNHKPIMGCRHTSHGAATFLFVTANRRGTVSRCSFVKLFCSFLCSEPALAAYFVKLFCKAPHSKYCAEDSSGTGEQGPHCKDG